MMDGAEGQVPSGAGGRIWLTRDVVRAAEKVPHASWPRGTLHTVDLMQPFPARPAGSRPGRRAKRRVQRQGRKVTETPFQGTALQGPSEWQRRVMQASTSKASAVQQLSTTTETPAEASQGFSHGPASANAEKVERADSNSEKRSLKHRAMIERMEKLASETKLVEEKHSRIEELQKLRKTTLQRARKGDLHARMNVDLGGLRHKLTSAKKQTPSSSKESQAHRKFAKSLGSSSLSGFKKKGNRRRPQRWDSVDRSHEITDVEDEPWRHNLTLIFQKGLEDLKTFFDSRGRTLGRAHRKEVLAVMDQYHANMLETIDKIRVIRGENRKERGQVSRMLERSEGLRRKLESVEEKCRELEFEISRVRRRLAHRENSARNYSQTQAKEISTHRAHVSSMKQQLDALTCDHALLDTRKEELNENIQSLKILHKQQQIQLFEAKKYQRQMLGIRWQNDNLPDTASATKNPACMRGSATPENAEKKKAPLSTIRATARARIVRKSGRAGNPKPTGSATMSEALEVLSSKALMLDTIRNCLVCMSCFNLANQCMMDWKTGELLCSSCCAEKGFLALDEGDASIKRVLQNPKLRALETTFAKHGMFDNVLTKPAGSSSPTASTALGAATGRLRTRDTKKKMGPVEIVKKLQRILKRGFTDLIRPPTPPPTGFRADKVNGRDRIQSESSALSATSSGGWRTPIEPW